MRFGPNGRPPVFHFLPASVPQFLYTQQKARKVNRPKPISYDKDQARILRTITEAAPPGFLSDPNIFPITPMLLKEIIELSEKSIGMMSHFCREIDVRYDGGDLSVVRTSDEFEFVKGGILQVYDYIIKCCPQAMSNFTMTARLLDLKVTAPENLIEEFLTTHRKIRSVCVGLDNISKTDELDAIDRDNTYLKFPVIWKTKNRKVLHLGSGSNTANNQIYLWNYYDRVYCVDPKITPSGHRCQEVFDPGKVKPGWDIVSDIAIGDTYGLDTSMQSELLKALWPLRTDRLIVVKLGVVDDCPAQYRAVMLRKPRPHNLEIVIELTDLGEPLRDIMNRIRPTIIATNKERTSRMLKQDFEKVIKPSAINADDLTDIFHLMEVVPDPPPKLMPPARIVSRNRAILDAIGVDRNSSRYLALRALARDPSFNFEAGGILPDAFRIAEGVACDFDPGFVDYRFALASTCKTAVHRGFKLRFANTWTIGY